MTAFFFMTASPYFSGAKVARVIGFFKAHKRLIAFTLVLAYAAFQLIYPDEFGRFLDLVFWGEPLQ